jgi:hypothetical protein
MSDEFKIGSTDGVSRRALLRGVAIAAGGAAIAVGTTMPAQAKMTQKAAGYQDKPNNGAACATCALFQSPAGCTLVEGPIGANGWCRFYSKKT